MIPVTVMDSPGPVTIKGRRLAYVVNFDESSKIKMKKKKK
jgi:hypothetical protein